MAVNRFVRISGVCMLSLAITALFYFGLAVSADAGDAQYEVTFDANGGVFRETDPDTGSAYTQMKETLDKGENNDVDFSIPIKNSALFAGWATDKAGKNIVYNLPENQRVDSTLYVGELPAFKYNFTGNITFYAVWVPGYTVTLDANGGYYAKYPIYGTLPSGTALAGNSQPIGYETSVRMTVRPRQALQVPEIPVHKDQSKIIAAYATDREGKNIVLADKYYAGEVTVLLTEYVPTRTITLYAIWKDRNYLDAKKTSGTASSSKTAGSNTSATANSKPKGTKITSLKPKSKAFTVKWKKQTTRTTGYQLQYSTNKKFKKGKKTITVKGSKKTSITVKKLKSKKVYYVRIRTYRKSGSKTYSSGWSPVKKVKTKK